MSKIRMHSRFAKRIWTAILLVALGSILVFFSIKIVSNSMSNLAYDLGEKSKVRDYQDTIIFNYNEYTKLVKKYNIEQNLNEGDFKKYSYVVSFQEYDPCGESKFKTIDDVKVNDKINITYKIHNKCGWCQKHLALHLIKIDKLDEEKFITYKYVYSKELDCGTVK